MNAERNRHRGRASGSSRFLGWIAVVVVIMAAIGYRLFVPTPIPVPTTLTIYACSVMDDAFADGVLPAFRRHWEARTGQRVEFVTTFAGSGVIADRILAKIPVQVAVLASEIDALRVADGGMAPGSPWRGLPHGGVLVRSPLVLVVREGNPKGIAGFADLAREDVEVVLPDPLTSGAGEWASLAFRRSAVASEDPTVGNATALSEVWRRAIATPASARDALAAFMAGRGDVTVAYEAQLARREPGTAIEVLCPSGTMVAEPIVTTVPRNMTDQERPVVRGLVDFLWSDDGQRILAEHGFRPVEATADGTSAGCPPLDEMTTLAAFGGARFARDTVLEPLWRELAADGPAQPSALR
jgi:sulfate transport system substrate-binding protein